MYLHKEKAAKISDTFSGTPLQRKVKKFTVAESFYDPPVTDLIDSVDDDYFIENHSEIAAKIRASGIPDPKGGTTAAPKRIKAEIKKGGTAPKRKTHKSGVVGKFGVAEYALKSGKTSEVFEGGHIIPHELWSDSDNEVDEADSYGNLVPMSRNMNVGIEDTWKETEKQMIDTVSNLKSGESLKMNIGIEHETWELPYSSIQKMFALTPEPKADMSDKVEMYGWLPKNISPNGNVVKAKKVKSSVDFNDVMENAVHDTHSEITTKEELIDALQSTPLWLRMDEVMQEKVRKL